jgi:hypothetical protein
MAHPDEHKLPVSFGNENSWTLTLTRGSFSLKKVIIGEASLVDLEDAMAELVFRMDTIGRILPTHPHARPSVELTAPIVLPEKPGPS